MKNFSSSLLGQLVKNVSSLAGLVIILLAVMVALLGANIRPDQSVDANSQQVSLAKLKPMSTAKFIVVPSGMNDNSTFVSRMLFGGRTSSPLLYPFDSLYFVDDLIHYTPHNREGEARGTVRFYRTIPVATVLVPGFDSSSFSNGRLTIYKAGTVDTISQVDFARVILNEHTETKVFMLGTDTFGRDLLSRIMGGTIVSLSVGVIAVIISLLIGILLGGLAGFYGGFIDKLIMWFVNVIWSVPTLLMVIAITVALGKGFTQVFIAVGFTMWVEVARVVRGQFIQLREKDYITAGKLMGFSDMRIIFKHLLPNAVAPLIVISAGNFSTAILLESGLSFLGIGAQVPMPSWGGIIKAHFNYITTDKAFLALIPGLCLSLLTLAFMLVGNGLRDALDVRSVEA